VASNNGDMAKTRLHTRTAVARLPGVSYAFLFGEGVTLH